jgi:hypothetical protein
MHLEEITQTGCVDRWHKYFTENWLLHIFVRGYLVLPVHPLVILHAPEVVVAESALRELGLNQRSKHAVEFSQNLVIILPATNAATVGPHGCEHKEGLVDNLLLLFLLFGSVGGDHIFIVFD